jgi:O-antigen ligase
MNASGRVPALGDGAQFAILIGASVAAAALLTLIAYGFSPVVALALPIAAAVVALVFLKPMAGVYLAVLAMPLERLAVPAGIAAELTPAKLTLVLVALAVALRWIYSGSVGPPGRVWLPFAGLLAVMATGIAFAPGPFTVAKLTIQWAAFLVVAMYVAAGTREQIERVFMCLAVSGGILGAIAALTSSQQSLVNGGDAATGRAQAGFDHPALLAFFLVIAFPPAAALAVRGSRVALRPLWALCAALTVSGIAFSLTRGAMIALAASLVVLLFLAPFRRWATVLLVGVTVFAIFNAGAIQRSTQLEIISQRITTIGKSTEATAANQRPYIWSKTPAIVFDHPFLGIGAAQFPLYAPRYDIVDYGGAPFVHAHDVLLTIAAENGLIGLGFLLWFGGAIVVTALRVLLRGTRSPDYHLAVGAAAAVTGAFVTGVADYPPATVSIMGMTMLVIGALVAVERLVRSPEPQPAQ